MPPGDREDSTRKRTLQASAAVNAFSQVEYSSEDKRWKRHLVFWSSFRSRKNRSLEQKYLLFRARKECFGAITRCAGAKRKLCIRMAGESHDGGSCERPPASLEESYRRCFVGGDLSAQYKLARPAMPPAMVADIVEYANQMVSCKEGVCVDVGCGPGQSTELFCPHFRKVVGTDISETQIGIARAACTAKNVSFEVAKAESLPLDAGSVALVSTVNALHWFHWDSFFAEVRRVLVDGGVFCPSLYRLRAVAEPGLEDCLEEFRYQEFKGYLTAQHDFWTYGYEKTEVPFSDVRKKDFAVKENTTLSAVMACVRTWSFVIRMEEKEPERAKQALERLETRIRSRLGKPDEDDPEVQVAYRASYILCRK